MAFRAGKSYDCSINLKSYIIIFYIKISIEPFSRGYYLYKPFRLNKKETPFNHDVSFC